MTPGWWRSIKRRKCWGPLAPVPVLRRGESWWAACFRGPQRTRWRWPWSGGAGRGGPGTTFAERYLFPYEVLLRRAARGGSVPPPERTRAPTPCGIAARSQMPLADVPDPAGPGMDRCRPTKTESAITPCHPNLRWTEPRLRLAPERYRPRRSGPGHRPVPRQHRRRRGRAGLPGVASRWRAHHAARRAAGRRQWAPACGGHHPDQSRFLGRHAADLAHDLTAACGERKRRSIRLPDAALIGPDSWRCLIALSSSCPSPPQML